MCGQFHDMLLRRCYVLLLKEICKQVVEHLEQGPNNQRHNLENPKWGRPEIRPADRLKEQTHTLAPCSH